ncbi:MAG: trigger factor family protein [Bacteroidia bacterium]|nr:trigger factor family protein [Bacteroidia bacterium]
MRIERKEKELLVDLISITLEPKDYLPKVDQQLKKLKKTVMVPGFRVGFAPDALIRKYYYKSVLVDAVDQLLSENLFKHIEENQLITLGRPMEAEGLKSNFNPDKEEDYVFHFEIGRAPEIDAKLGKEITLTYKNATLTDDFFQQHYNDLLTRNGKSVELEKAGPDVMIYAGITELENGAPKEGGIQVKKYIFFNKLPEQAQRQFENVALNQNLDIKADEIFPDESDRNYMLNIKKESGINTAEIMLRIVPEKYLIWKKAEPNQELFDKIYGKDTIKSEDEFKEKFRQDLLNELSHESDRIFLSEVKNKLLEYFQLPLPDQFLKRWLKSVLEKPISDEELKKEYPAFARSTRWELIMNAIANRYGLKVEQEELEAYVRNVVVNYFVGQNIPIIEDYVRKSVRNILENKDKARDYVQDLLTEKIAALCKEHCTIVHEELKEEEVKA